MLAVEAYLKGPQSVSKGLRSVGLCLLCAGYIAAASAQQDDVIDTLTAYDATNAVPWNEDMGPAPSGNPTESTLQDQPIDVSQPYDRSNPDDRLESSQPAQVTEDSPPHAALEILRAKREQAGEYLRQARQAFDVGDVINAMTFYRKAAELGEAAAQTRLAYLLDHAERNGEAALWYAKAAAQGDAEAEFRLAVMHSAPGELPTDLAQAVQLLESSAQRGYAPAIRVLASAYENGDLGLIRNYDSAISWLQAGAQIGDHWSVSRLSRAYRNGELGLRMDAARALEWETRAAQARKGLE